MQAISKSEQYFLKEISQTVSNQLPIKVNHFQKRNVNTLSLAKKCKRL